jgi:hypothetical protein
MARTQNLVSNATEIVMLLLEPKTFGITCYFSALPVSRGTWPASGGLPLGASISALFAAVLAVAL